MVEKTWHKEKELRQAAGTVIYSKIKPLPEHEIA